MGMKLEKYIIYGVWLGEEFTHDYLLRPEREELDRKLVNTENPWLIVDGMDGKYSFFGIIKRIDEDEVISGYDFDCDNLVITSIKDKWDKYFSEFEFPNIRTYHLNHYV